MKKLLVTLLLCYFVTLSLVHAEPCDNLGVSQEWVDCLQKEKDKYSNQAQTLVGQIAYYDSQIKLAQSKIIQTEEQIKSVTTRITQLEDKLRERSALLEKQIVQTYKKGMTDPLQIIFGSGNVSTLLSQIKYLQIVQANNRKFLYDTQLVQTNYAQQKTLIEESRKKLQSQKELLNSYKIERDNLLKQTKNNESNYQKLLVQARAELAAMGQNSVGATILSNQTFKSDWGYYYSQRDSQWALLLINGRRDCTVEENGKVKVVDCNMIGFGCLISSASMVASHYGKSITPDQIALSSGGNFQVGTALLSYVVNANGVSITRTSYGRNLGIIDSELASGRPVIVGLYSGPGHFIVLKSGSSGNYIMNDPITENGHDIAFSSKYNLSNITDVEKVSVN